MPPDRPLRRPLEDTYLSRQPLHLLPGPEPGSIRLVRGSSRTPMAANGEHVGEERTFSAGEVERGVVLPRAAQKILAMGPKALVIKHGEYGATIFFREGAFGIGRHPFRAPALPIEEVKDPTGAGDSFAGGFMGYVASQKELNREVLKRALFYGGVMGSFAVERFGTERLQSLTREEIDARFQIFRELTHLE